MWRFEDVGMVFPRHFQIPAFSNHLNFQISKNIVLLPEKRLLDLSVPFLYICTTMVVERIQDNRIQITLSSAVDGLDLQRLIDYIGYLESVAESKATQADADRLADEVNMSWWGKNKSRFVK